MKLNYCFGIWHFVIFFNIGPVGKCLREIVDKKGKDESEWNEKRRCINEWDEWKC